MPQKIEEPKDLGVKIGTVEQVVWTKVAKEAKVLIEQSKEALIIQRAMLIMAELKIIEEKKKMENVNRNI